MIIKAQVMVEVEINSREPIPTDELEELILKAASSQSIGGASIHYGWYQAKRGKSKVISVKEYFKEQSDDI